MGKEFEHPSNAHMNQAHIDEIFEPAGHEILELIAYS